MSDPKHGLTHSELGELDPDFEAADHGPTRPASWGDLMALLDECWPADFFPTLEDDPTRDAGARIVSLLRWVDRLQAQLDGRPRVGEDPGQFLARMFEQAKHAPIVRGDRLGSVDPATVLEYVEDAPDWVDHTKADGP